MELKINALIFILFFLILSCSDDESSINADCGSCDLAPMVGPCNAAVVRFYFDKNQNACKEFIWGGCGGVVPFESMQECLDCACN